MAEDSEQIRREIEETRQAIRQEIQETRAEGKVGSRPTARKGDGLRSKLKAVGPPGQDVKRGVRRAAELAEENPLGVGVGAVAVGFVAGLLVPSTRVDHEKIGPVADQVKEKATETSQEALERGERVTQSAAETAKESGQRHAQELPSSASERADGPDAERMGGRR